MSWTRRMSGATLLLAVFSSLSVGSSFAQVYQLVNDVIDDGGTKMTSSGYICRGSFGQSTIGKIQTSTSGYIAYIGFWHPPYAGPGVEEDFFAPGVLPIVFSLFQNYPNPFSRTTHIRYTVPGRRGAEAQRGDLSTSHHINLSIYDVCGRLVRTLVDEPQEAGHYKVTWDVRGVSGERLPNGVYFCRLVARHTAGGQARHTDGGQARHTAGGQAGDPALSEAEVFIRTKKMVALR